MNGRTGGKKAVVSTRNIGLPLLLLFIIFHPAFFFSLSRHDEILVTAVGDVMLGRNVGRRYQSPIRSDDISGILRSGDAAFGNLEACFGGGNSPTREKTANLKAPDEAFSALRNLGFTVASLANNHCMDFGSDAVSYTRALLESTGIKSVGGLSEQGMAIPVVLRAKSVRIGFLGYSAHVPREACAEQGYSGTAPLSGVSVMEDVSALRARVDVLIVSVHWGQEYSDRPTEGQILMAHRLVDAGADIILGHHPHVLQAIENYRGRLIAYSLGNFIFDQVRPDTTQTIILQCGLRDSRIYMVKVIPVIVDRYLPRLATADEARAVMDRVRKLSEQLTPAPDFSSWRIQWDDRKRAVGDTNSNESVIQP